MAPHNNPPALTDDERLAALKKAVQARHERSELLKSIKAGKTTISDVFEMADKGSAVVKRMRVYHLVKALPGFGKARTEKWMEENQIAATRRISGLGNHQREALFELVK